MPWGFKYSVLRPHFDDPPGIHNGNAITELRDHADIMGDEDQRQAAFPAKLIQEGQDFRLHGDIKGRGWLIGDHQLGLVDQGERDPDPLAHAA